MPEIFNEKALLFESRNCKVPDYAGLRSAKLEELVKSKRLQFDIRSLEPKTFSFPYHSHRNAEELFVMLSGSATLRTPEGFRELSEGDIVFFEMGPTGAHQLYNHTEEACRYLDIRTIAEVDICDYPDSRKINIIPYKEIYQKESQVDYYKDEDKVREKCTKDIVGDD